MDSAATVPSQRLRAWMDDWSPGRFERPQYANPGELKADLRVVLDALDRVKNEAPNYVKALVGDA